MVIQGYCMKHFPINGSIHTISVFLCVIPLRSLVFFIQIKRARLSSRAFTKLWCNRKKDRTFQLGRYYFFSIMSSWSMKHGFLWYRFINLSMAGTSTKALFKGIDTWKKETMMKKVEFSSWFLLSFPWISSFGYKIINEDFDILFPGSNQVGSRGVQTNWWVPYDNNLQVKLTYKNSFYFIVIISNEKLTLEGYDC